VADADDLVSLDADPDVMRFVTGGLPTSRDEIENEVLPAFLGYYQRYEGFGFWAAVEKTTGEFLGWFHFRPRQDADPGEVELGYRLRKSAWGKGYATEGSRALIGKGFTEFGVQRVVAEAMAVNTASRRVMEKSGLKLVRTFHQPWPYRLRATSSGTWSMRWTRPAGSMIRPTLPAACPRSAPNMPVANRKARVNTRPAISTVVILPDASRLK
jgi:RimJ/RimL family protein N-acetyltransferase